MGSKSSPSDTIHLKLILVSGKTAEFDFTPTTTASDVAKHVFENWPDDWGTEQKVERYEVLRLIYQGRFLHGNVTLGALRLQQGKTTVMHLVPREHLPEPTSADQKRKHKFDGNNENQDHTNGAATTTAAGGAVRTANSRATSPHRSTTASPNSTTTGCCESCTIS